MTSLLRTRACPMAIAAALCAGCDPSSATGPVAAPPMDASASPGDAQEGAPDDASLGGAVSTPSDASEGGDAGVAVGDAGVRRVLAYTGGYAKTIRWFSMDAATGALTPGGSIAAFGASPSFLAHNAAMTNLYAVDENDTGRVGAYAIDPVTGGLTFLNAASSGGKGPAFVAVDGTGRFVFVANYGDGTIAVLPVGAGGRVSAASDTRPVGAAAHMMIADPSNHFVFVACKGADYVAQFVFDASRGKLTPNAVPTVSTAAGAGPRHLAFHPSGRFAYLISELASTMTTYAFDGTSGTLTAIETQSTIPSTFHGTNTGAEVWVHPSGKWVVGSNRGDDSLVVFAVDPATGRLTLEGRTSAGGMTPRDFAFDPTGTRLYAADQDSSLVVPFRFDAAQGTLAPLGNAIAVPSVTYVGFGAL